MLRLLLPMILVLAAFVGSGDIIHACVNNTSGAVRIVTEGTACAAGETPIEWGVIGLQGPQGPTGPQGPAGVGDLGCTTDQIVKWDDAAGKWQCANQPNVTALESRIAALEALLAGVTRSGSELTISGANLHLVNGAGSTDVVNGLGNLIIGYNEQRTYDGATNERTGSHMLVLGKENNYTNAGGIVAGTRNTTSGLLASALGGGENTASGSYSVVLGGARNTASGGSSAVGGGEKNRASGNLTSVSGGIGRSMSTTGGWAVGPLSQVGVTVTVSGANLQVVDGSGDTDGDTNGLGNVIIGYNELRTYQSAINERTGSHMLVVGIEHNYTSYGGVVFGLHNGLSAAFASVTGGENNRAAAMGASVTGGVSNTASGSRSVVSGGATHTASGDLDWRAGGLFQDD